LVTDFLCDALGYDKYGELTTEYQVKGEFADYGVRLDRQLVAFIEVKRCTTRLSAKHLRQVTSYAVNEGVEWMWLTNGATWQVYHLTGGLPIQVDLALEIDLLADEPVPAKIDAFFYLTRESFRRRQLDELWQAKRATSPASLAAVILTEPCLDAIRRELRRQTGQNVDLGDLAQHLRAGVLQPELTS
jgi:predicted type IV restriction endonuclease